MRNISLGILQRACEVVDGAKRYGVGRNDKCTPLVHLLLWNQQKQDFPLILLIASYHRNS